MRLLIVLVLLAACRERHEPVPRDKPAPADAGGQADPWAVAPAAQDPDAPPSLTTRRALADKACPAVAKPYFFAIEKAGKVSHILGTRHVGVGLEKFPPVVATTLHEAKLAVFEVAPDDESGGHSPDIALAKELGPDLWKHYVELVGKQMAQEVETGRPEVALIGMMVLYENIGSALDTQLEHEVETAKIPARGLETAAFQDALIEKLFDLRMLRAAISQTKDRKEMQDESTKDLAEYCAGTDETAGLDEDTRRIMLAAGYTPAELAAIDDQMVFKRNATWIPKLEPLLVSGDVFIAVGADHLIGDRGVVALLRARGFTVTRIEN